jgi:hypothetical protein
MEASSAKNRGMFVHKNISIRFDGTQLRMSDLHLAFNLVKEEEQK